MRSAKAEDEVHVVLDEQHRDVPRQGRHRGEQFVPFRLRHAGGRLVEQQHARAAGEGDGDLEKPLLAVRQVRRSLVEHVREIEACRDVGDVADDRILAPGDTPPIPTAAQSLGHSEPQGFRRRHGREELVDLKGAHEAAAHAQLGAQIRDLGAFEKNASCARRQNAGEKINEGGLAGAVWADEGMARALL